jgi:hypothetical protein
MIPRCRSVGLSVARSLGRSVARSLDRSIVIAAGKNGAGFGVALVPVLARSGAISDEAGFMELVELNCRNCGEVVDPRRVELGYDYCLKAECQQRCVKRVELAALGVNKAADYYTKADEVLPPPSPRVASIDDEEQVADPAPKRQPAPARARHPETTLERLRRMEKELDEALRQSYERFQGGVITAKEMEGESNALVQEFNRLVTAENIRYRSMLRKRRRQ